MIDSHCHIDQYANPEAIASACERKRISTVAVTSLPSHYEMAAAHLADYEFVHAALGFHPLLAAENESEVAAFESLAKDCRFIGEIGMDGSRQGLPTLERQGIIFDRVITAIADKKRFVTVHSRRSVDRIVCCLNGHSMYPVVFHWFSGTKTELATVLDAGHSLSFNPSMAQSAKWQDEIRYVPIDRILTETDGPYCKVSGRACRPEDIKIVIEWLASKFGMSLASVVEKIAENFDKLRG